MISSTTAAQTAIAWAATNKRTCIVPSRNLPQALHELQLLAVKNRVTVTRHETQIHFTYDPTIPLP